MEDMHILYAKQTNDPESILTLKLILEGYCFSGQFDKAKILLEKVDGLFDINYDDGLLILAATERKDYDFLNFLFANGADIRYCNKSPLIIAHYDQSDKMKTYLIEHGADPKVLEGFVYNKNYPRANNLDHKEITSN